MLTAREEVEHLFADLHEALRKNLPQKASEISDKLEVLTLSHIVPDPGIEWQSDYKLTATEARIASFLYTRCGKTVRRESIYMDAYSGCDEGPGDKIIDIFICKIRKKLKGHPEFTIETVRGTGYSMKDRGELKKAA